jgi:hypothetical protein
MGAANVFLNAFFSEFPQAKDGQLNLKELNELLANFQHSVNNKATEDFDGLTPEQMHVLLYNPLSEGCILKIDPAHVCAVREVPLFKLAELLLAEISRSKKIKLTSKGNLPIRVCDLLVRQRLITWKYMEYAGHVTEETIPYLAPLKHYLIDTGIVKKVHNTLSLTRNVQQFIQQDELLRFVKLLHYFGHHFNWRNFYEAPDHGRCGQLGWAFSLLLLKKYGDTPRESEFYSDKLLEAFENEVDPTDRYLAQYDYIYAARFFECFASWFGFVTIARNKRTSFTDQLIVTTSDLFNRLFEMKN